VEHVGGLDSGAADRRCPSAGIDPTIAMPMWMVRDDEISDRWPIDLRGR